VGKANLKLYAIKNSSHRLERVQLVVVDLDRSRHYPHNFVCVLPQYFRILEKRSSKFAKLFGAKSLLTAKRLLQEAQHQEEDPEIKAIITRRITDIDAKNVQGCSPTQH